MKTKTSTKPKQPKYNQMVLRRLQAKYGLGSRMLREYISGRRPCEMADTLAKEYKQACKTYDAAIAEAQARMKTL